MDSNFEENFSFICKHTYQCTSIFNTKQFWWSEFFFLLYFMDFILVDKVLRKKSNFCEKKVNDCLDSKSKQNKKKNFATPKVTSKKKKRRSRRNKSLNKMNKKRSNLFNSQWKNKMIINHWVQGEQIWFIYLFIFEEKN